MPCLRRFFAVFLVSTAALGVANAQMPGGAGGEGGRGGRHAGGKMGEAKPDQGREGRAKGQPDASQAAQMQLDMTYEGLNLAADQLPLWQAYAAKVSLVIDDQKRWKQRALDPNFKPERSGPTPRAIELQLDEARNRLTALEDVAAPAAALYQKLDIRQRAVADQHMAAIVGLLAHNDSMLTVGIDAKP